MRIERDVKDACKKLFVKHNVWYYMPVATGFGVQGIPDFLGAVNGRMFAVETKFGTKKPTPIQEAQIHRLQLHKVPVWVVTDRNIEQFARDFEEWVNANR